MSEPAYRFYPAARLELEPHVPGARYFAVGLDRSMLTYFEIDPHTHFPAHEHESEQITLVLSGRLRFLLEGDEVVVGAGEVIAIPSKVRHAVTSLGEPVEAVDAWSQPLELAVPDGGKTDA